MNHPFHIIAVLCLCLILSGCGGETATRPMESISMDEMAEDPTAAWRSCFFRITWPEQSEPNWGVDLLIAHQIIKPLLDQHGKDLHRWRFHRRAARDVAGHQFSFIFYSSTATARTIMRQIETDNLRRQMLDQEILAKSACESPDSLARPAISDTSDPAWPEPVQKHWPAYIMGVSNLWLGLIDEMVADGEPAPADLNQVIQHYNEVNESVTELWQKQGQHAFLHHMSAIFGYEQLLIRY